MSIKFEFSTHDAHGQVFIVRLVKPSSDSFLRIEFYTYGESSELLKWFLLDTFLMLRGALVLRRNVSMCDFEFNDSDVEYMQSAIAKFLAHHAEFKEA